MEGGYHKFSRGYAIGISNEGNKKYIHFSLGGYCTYPHRNTEINIGGKDAHNRAFCVSITHPPIQKN